jgi:N-acetylmuramoyl-L-alanine amidase
MTDISRRQTVKLLTALAASSAVPFKRDYHQMAGFAVLKAPDMPAILFEAGYISSPSDVTRLTSAEGRRAIANSLRRAVDVHFARHMASR